MKNWKNDEIICIWFIQNQWKSHILHQISKFWSFAHLRFGVIPFGCLVSKAIREKKEEISKKLEILAIFEC